MQRSNGWNGNRTELQANAAKEVAKESAGESSLKKRNGEVMKPKESKKGFTARVNKSKDTDTPLNSKEKNMKKENARAKDKQSKMLQEAKIIKELTNNTRNTAKQLIKDPEQFLVKTPPRSRRPKLDTTNTKGEQTAEQEVISPVKCTRMRNVTLIGDKSLSLINENDEIDLVSSESESNSVSAQKTAERTTLEGRIPHDINKV
eukprot:TRINITY_DN741_c0_g2_i2.p2 TRINITY_DN741_c0_g2~~TRINITY_DN741_c0_g2_i2.p2  ORF type:complete len:204 (-),score=47.94 TRINITY_DN741_c0_g2_i2:350-961(-)